ncbi:ABC transporter ATP-binding protein [Roseivivax isoporae]|uniref:2-phenylethanol ABC transporter ATP-binding protein n=1 Tax=Roseivivax isoporae LMG 25204 TaxID=1449351 RepID=X7FCG6_9RHOB|nr:ABC transporter ATP-binding protein [Roseivivax isoporae]ETX29749.1 2-phenylethanol ABC transporter ATP-binding protein [Roseivivax isoporae LMG 25204]
MPDTASHEPGGLAVRDVSFRYGSRTALDGVGFEVAPGRFAALLGPNGAGKSTLFSLLTRLFTTRDGRILVAGHDLSRHPRAALARMGVVFQSQTLDLDLTIRQNLSYFAALHGLSGREAALRIDAALERLAIADRAGEKARNLNGGHRRRTEIARALVHRPSVLLLDEPTVGLDAAARAAITDHVHRLAAEDGLTVLWATHLTDEVTDGDRLVVLHRGRVLADGECGALRGGRSLRDYFLATTGADAPEAVPGGPA